MVKRVAQFVRQQQQQTLGNVIQCDPAQHGAVQQGWEVMMKVQHSGHRPERRIMQDPAKKEPLASMRYSLSPLDVNSTVAITAPLFAHACMHIESYEYHEKDYVAPPDDGIA